MLLFVLGLTAAFAAAAHNETSVECVYCGLVLNEVEAMLAENLTLANIEARLKKDFCGNKSSSIYHVACDLLVDQLPVLVKKIDSRDAPGRVCVELKLCPMPFAGHPDPIEAPTFIVNLDLAPADRWKEICSMPYYAGLIREVVAGFDSILPGHGKELNVLGEDLLDHYFPKDLGAEIKGCATAANAPYGWLALLNIGYEVSDACTSILAQSPTGHVLHSRNLDFWDGWGFTDLLRNLTFQAEMQSGGKTVFHLTTMAGYVGALSGLRIGGFSVTINTRFYPNGVIQMFYEVIAAIKEKNATLVSFLTRDVLQQTATFSEALARLENSWLIADVYYTIAGVNPGEGVIISRNRTDTADAWRLDAPSRWYEVQTNYDHWKQPPWIDDRVKPANAAMEAVGYKNISLTGMMKVMSTKPVLNLQSTHTILSCPATGEYHSYRRFCNFPCAE